VPEEQQFIRPDGPDPVAANRKMMERFHKYTLDHDLTTSSTDDGMTRGVAAGQERGGLIRKEGWQLNPDRDLQMQASSGVKPLNAGIRSGGVGVSLSSFNGQQPVEPLENMRGNHEERPGMGRKSVVGSLPVPICEQVDLSSAAKGAAYGSAISANCYRDAQFEA